MGLKKLTHSGPDETEIAESKRADPSGPTLVFSTVKFSLVSSSLVGFFFPNKPTA